MLPYTKKLGQIYNRVKLLAQGGNECIFDYYKYIDEIILNGDYSAFEDVMATYYRFNITKIGPVKIIKDQTWLVVRRGTNSSLAEQMASLYSKKGVYQQGLVFYLSLDNTALGEISPFNTISNIGAYYDLNNGYSESVKIVNNNQNLPVKITGLNVITYFPSPTHSFVVAYNISDLDYNSNLIYNYGIAIDLLLQQL